MQRRAGLLVAEVLVEPNAGVLHIEPNVLVAINVEPNASHTHTATHCTFVEPNASHTHTASPQGVLQCVAARCSVLQCVAVCCSWMHRDLGLFCREPGFFCNNVGPFS